MVWVRAVSEDASLVEEYREALLREGLKPPQCDNPRDAGVLLLTADSNENFACLERQLGADARVIVAASSADLRGEDYWKAFDLGAEDVVVSDGLIDTAPLSARRLQRWSDIDKCFEDCARAINVVGASGCWRNAMCDVVNGARFSNASILLLGETGTGKEIAARIANRAIFPDGGRKLTVVDCTTIVPTLSGSEFFGHERGAFTGAVAQRDGAFAEADGGVLFLDEVGELPLDLQAQLLRVLQERRYKRVGGNKWFDTHFRLIAATNRDLKADVEAGRFRRDLYHRLAGIEIELPPLRERREDILPLFFHFAHERLGDPCDITMDPPVANALMNFAYSGNVRELKQISTRIIRHGDVDSVHVTGGDLPRNLRPCGGARRSKAYQLSVAAKQAVELGCSLNEIKDVAANAAIQAAIKASGGNLKNAASALKVTARALQMRQKQADEISGEDIFA